MIDKDYRLECLKLAIGEIKAIDADIKDTVELAKIFYEFVANNN